MIWWKLIQIYSSVIQKQIKKLLIIETRHHCSWFILFWIFINSLMINIEYSSVLDVFLLIFQNKLYYYCLSQWWFIEGFNWRPRGHFQSIIRKENIGPHGLIYGDVKMTKKSQWHQLENIINPMKFFHNQRSDSISRE